MRLKHPVYTNNKNNLFKSRKNKGKIDKQVLSKKFAHSMIIPFQEIYTAGDK